MRLMVTALVFAVILGGCAESMDGRGVTVLPTPAASPNGSALVTITGAAMAQLPTDAWLLLDLTASDAVYVLDGLGGPLPIDRIDVLTPEGMGVALGAWLPERAGMSASVVADERVIIAPSKNVTERPSPTMKHCPCKLSAGKCPCTNTCFVGLPLVCHTSCGCGSGGSSVLDSSKYSSHIEGFWSGGDDGTPTWSPKNGGGTTDPPDEAQDGGTPAPIKPPNKDSGGSQGGSGCGHGGSSGGSSGGGSGGGSGGSGGGGDSDDDSGGGDKPGGWAF